jgi:glycosyltransferase involved in cell wall biosynthesis
MRATVAGYDRVCVASDWGTREARMVRADAEWLPHGLWMDKFTCDLQARLRMGWDHQQVHLGCNMSNQSRKDWPAAFECAAVLKAQYGNRFRAWFHTDQPIHYWNFYALATDYEIGDCIEVTTDLTDEQLALRYSACDCTILPSGGEGFGYPIAESMACGTACVVADYAGGAELVEEACRVEPVAYRIDTIHNVRRAVLSGYGFAQKAMGQIEEKRRDWEYRSGQLRETVAHLDWTKLRVVWERWLRNGL